MIRFPEREGLAPGITVGLTWVTWLSALLWRRCCMEFDVELTLRAVRVLKTLLSIPVPVCNVTLHQYLRFASSSFSKGHLDNVLMKLHHLRPRSDPNITRLDLHSYLYILISIPINRLSARRHHRPLR